MTNAGESTTPARSRPLLVGVLTLLWAVFGFFTICQVLSKDSAARDPEKIKELQNATFTVATRSSSDWPQWRGPHRDGVSSETGLRLKWPEAGPRKIWEQPSGQGFSAVAVAGGRTITMVQDKDQEAVVCWNAETGAEMWRYRYAASFHNEFGNGPRATPTIDGDLVVTHGATGILTCLQIPANATEQPRALLEQAPARRIWRQQRNLGYFAVAAGRWQSGLCQSGGARGQVAGSTR